MKAPIPKSLLRYFTEKEIVNFYSITKRIAICIGVMFLILAVPLTFRIVNEYQSYKNPFDRQGVTFYAPTHLPPKEKITKQQLYVEYIYWPISFGDWSPRYHGTDVSIRYKNLHIEEENNKEIVKPHACKERCKNITTPGGTVYHLHLRDMSDELDEYEQVDLKKDSTRIYISYKGTLSEDEWSKMIDSFNVYAPKDIEIIRTYPNQTRM